MQHIKNYMAKVEAAVKSRMPTKTSKKGLLAPTKTSMSSEKKTDTDLLLIATYVAGIRAARQEIKNGD